MPITKKQKELLLKQNAWVLDYAKLANEQNEMGRTHCDLFSQYAMEEKELERRVLVLKQLGWNCWKEGNHIHAIW